MSGDIQSDSQWVWQWVESCKCSSSSAEGVSTGLDLFQEAGERGGKIKGKTGREGERKIRGV